MVYEDIKQQFTLFDCAKRAIEECCELYFHYRKRGTRQNQLYIVSPYQLRNQNGIWYVLAVHDGLIKSFCLSRCQNMKMADTFVPDATVLDRIKQEDSIYFQERVPEVHILVAAKVADYFIRRKLLPKQELLQEYADGRLLLSCKEVHEHEILPIVQYWLPHLSIQSPIDWQDKLLQLMTGYLKKSEGEQ